MWGFGISPWCVVLVCSWRRPVADRHLPFPWTLSLHRLCPSASHHPVSFLFLLAQSFPLYFPFLSLGRLCQRSPRTFRVSLLCVECTRRRATALTVGQVGALKRLGLGLKRSSQTGGEGPLPKGGFWAVGCPLVGSFPRRGYMTTLCLSDPAPSPPCGERIMHPLPPLYVHGVCLKSLFPRVACAGVVGGGWRRVLGRDGWFLLRALGVGRRGVVGRVLSGDGWILLCALGVREWRGVVQHGLAGDGWRGGWRMVECGDGLVPPGVVGGMRRMAVCWSVLCSTTCSLSHLPWLAPLLVVPPRGAHPHKRRLWLGGGWCRVISGGGLGH